MKRTIIVDVICYLFLLLFIYAAANKILDYEKFRTQLGQSPLLTVFSSQISWVIPALEIAIAVMIILPGLRLLGLYASFSLMVLFSAYIVVILHFSPYVPCACGGIFERWQWQGHLVFNVAFVLLGAIGVLIHPEKHITQ